MPNPIEQVSNNILQSNPHPHVNSASSSKKIESDQKNPNDINNIQTNLDNIAKDCLDIPYTGNVAKCKDQMSTFMAGLDAQYLSSIYGVSVTQLPEDNSSNLINKSEINTVASDESATN